MVALGAIERSPELQVLVTRIDFGEGKLNGVALARMLRLKRPAIKAVFVAQSENLKHAGDLGEHLPMPFDHRALVEAVGRLTSQLDSEPQTAPVS